MQVPYELLNKKFRAAQKQLDREVSHVQAAALELERGLAVETVGAGEISRILDGMVEKLQVLKRKSKEDIRLILAMLTGHDPLRKHLMRVGLSQTDECRHCREEEESAERIWLNCPAISKIRKIPGSISPQSQEHQRTGALKPDRLL
ncbi:hypothetical protein J6590_073334 [Homalodisca vitripennis]|nr:hypothetical protein J6590_073334 [Homalodisca vitripennis]